MSKVKKKRKTNPQMVAKAERRQQAIEALHKIVSELPKSNCKVSWPSPTTLHVRFFVCNRVYNWYPGTGTVWERETGHFPGKYTTVKEMLDKLLQVIRLAKREKELEQEMDSILAQNYT
ncbi:hypothetical protein [Frigoriglobus tundricola]|uniref:Uncharacterized protein n=1 Tax=Frigoriglobus tundricola TaxID=2774151 RepID=A0A6M5YIU4_9BACT|nr:hypothetical protein [Frigoriglobus tundricola]QJW93250.1 hypothetical protein FTUN_0755 [Frigoriglobus tundricola]